MGVTGVLYRIYIEFEVMGVDLATIWGLFWGPFWTIWGPFGYHLGGHFGDLWDPLGSPGQLIMVLLTVRWEGTFWVPFGPFVGYRLMGH